MSDELLRLLEADRAAAASTGQLRQELARAEDLASLRRDQLIADRRKEAEKEMAAYERSLKDWNRRLADDAQEAVNRATERMLRVRDASFEDWVTQIVQAVIDDA